LFLQQSLARILWLIKYHFRFFSNFKIEKVGEQLNNTTLFAEIYFGSLFRMIIRTKINFPQVFLTSRSAFLLSTLLIAGKSHNFSNFVVILILADHWLVLYFKTLDLYPSDN